MRVWLKKQNSAERGGNHLMIPVTLFSTPNGKYAYDTNLNEFVVISDESYNILKGHLSGEKDTNQYNDELNKYVQMGLFKESIVKELKHPYSDILETLLNRKMSHIILQLTQGCNLRCDYCVYSSTNNIANRTHSNKHMSWNVAKRAIDFLYEHSIDSDKVIIGFYGGEPLLEFNLIKKIVDYCNATFCGKDIEYGITTNATMLNEEILDFMYENDVRIMISIDGPQSIHDKNRKYVSGKGSYQDVIANIKRVLKKYPNYYKKISYSMVVDPNNDFDCISEISTIQNGILPEKVFSVFVEKKEAYCFPNEYVTKHQYNKFLAFLSYFERYERANISPLVNNELVSFINDYEMKDVRGALSLVDSPAGPCAVGHTRPFVDVEGNIFPCERVGENKRSMLIGNVYKGFDVDRAIELLNVSQITSDECRNCWCFKYCTQCAKHADVGTRELSPSKRLEKCVEVKKSVYERMRQILLMYELETNYKDLVALKRSRTNE